MARKPSTPTNTTTAQDIIGQLTPKGRDVMRQVGNVATGGGPRLSFFDDGVQEGSGIWGECLVSEMGHKSSGVINRLRDLGLFVTSEQGVDDDSMWWDLTALGAEVALAVADPAPEPEAAAVTSAATPVAVEVTPAPVAVEKPAATTAVCSTCDRTVRINKDGQLRKHRGNVGRECPGRVADKPTTDVPAQMAAPCPTCPAHAGEPCFSGCVNAPVQEIAGTVKVGKGYRAARKLPDGTVLYRVAKDGSGEEIPAGAKVAGTFRSDKETNAKAGILLAQTALPPVALRSAEEVNAKAGALPTKTALPPAAFRKYHADETVLVKVDDEWLPAAYVRPTNPADGSVGFHLVTRDGYATTIEVHPNHIRKVTNRPSRPAVDEKPYADRDNARRNFAALAEATTGNAHKFWVRKLREAEDQAA